MLKKSICRLGPCPTLTRLWNLRLRPRIKVASDVQEPLMKTAVTELNATKLLFGPIRCCRPRLWRGYRLAVGFAQSLPGFRLQSIYEDPLHRRRLLMLGVLPASALSLSDLQPIRRP